MKRVFCTFTVACLLLSSISCKRETIQPSVNWQADLTLPAPLTLKSLFLNLSPQTLRTGLSTEQTQTVASKIASFFRQRFSLDLRADFRNDPNGVVLLGLAYSAAIESRSNDMRTVSVARMAPDPGGAWGCFMTAVSGFIGITQAKAIWAAFEAGATASGVISAVGLIARRTASAISVGLMILSVIDCLDWW